ncbi:MAG: hypothetical protein U5N55_11660 [Cypionkella sp.]|nr:hypothetical protein [Cypionkella sp.]
MPDRTGRLTVPMQAKGGATKAANGVSAGEVIDPTVTTLDAAMIVDGIPRTGRVIVAEPINSGADKSASGR